MRLSIKAVMGIGLSALLLMVGGIPVKAHQKALHITLAKELQSCPAAYQALKQNKLQEVHKLASNKACPRLAKIGKWWALKEGSSSFTFLDYIVFVKQNPMWPRVNTIKTNAEYALNDNVPDRVILQWFKTQPPQTVNGRLYYIKALQRTQQTAHAVRCIRDTWRNLDFMSQAEQAFVQKYNAYLRPHDHYERANRLLNLEKIEQAQRMLRYLKPDEKAWARARIALVRNKPDVQEAFAGVPGHLKSEPGLLYDRLKRFRKLEADEAFSLFLAVPKHQHDKNLWWTERKVLARRALNVSKPALAYQIMHGHGFKEGEEFAEAEWFLGWIALSYLHKPQAAIKHFEAFYRGVQTPLSRSKAAYWAGRTAEHLGNATLARSWYQRGTNAVTSYYGQLSLQKLKIAAHNLRSDAVQFSAQEREQFAKQEIPQILRLLGSAGAEKLILEFAYVYAKKAPLQSDRHLLLDLVHEIAPHYVVAIAKQAERHSPMLVKRAYPTLKHFGLKRHLPVDPAFAHAIIRQESDFNPKAVSGAGAQGLTQLMPETAKMIAAKLNMPYQSHALIHNPGYNLDLGMAYMADRLRRYEGSYVLALASYNAGSGRVQEWLKTFGDPRLPGVDIVNWIERIPYAETRTYIHRVMANLYIYRNIFNKDF